MIQKKQHKLLCILAHPDDESLGFGGTLAKYAAEGVETYLITATRAEYGWFGKSKEYPGEDELGEIRKEELHQSAEILGLKGVAFLGYLDGQLDSAEPDEVINTIADHIRRIRPDVVLTFDPYGAYGHPDHIAICQFTTAAIVKAAQHSHLYAAHQVQKLYYRVETLDEMAEYELAFGEIAMTIDDIKRKAVGWPEWAITTRIDIVPYWNTVWNAVCCHRTQLPNLDELKSVYDEKPMWKSETYYRVFSMINSGRAVETDIFAGL